MEIKLPGRANRRDGLLQLADSLQEISQQIGFKISARGWCYQLEGFGLITKAEFDKVENAINTCRAEGYLPIDFTAEEEARRFHGIEIPETLSPTEYLKAYLEASLGCESWYIPDWWAGEDYYIQMVVEKIDLRTLFEPVCQEYHIPIATSKGWSSMLQRAEYAKRFKQAEDDGLKCVLLYYGDHDPDGLRISNFLYKNIADLQYIFWNDGVAGYDPDELVIDRFGLNYDFIQANNLTWIDNLITASKRDLASPTHPNHFLPYVQEYLAKYGARKCEANAIVVRPAEARQVAREAIEKYLGAGALDRFAKKHEVIKEQIADFREETGLDTVINEALSIIDSQS